MRIGNIKKEINPRTYSKKHESEECHNCHCERVKLYGINNVSMLACVNQNCFLYTDITKLKTWTKQD